MGIWKRLASAFGMSKDEAKVLVVGLDNSGKSTIINQLKPKKVSSAEIVPTVGFSVERFSKGGMTFDAFDMSGVGRYRSLWEQYYREATAIIFVVDSTDKIRTVIAKDELETMLKHPDIAAKRIPILFFANKMDLPGAMEPPEVMAGLGLEAVKDKPWHIQASNALSGEGLVDGVMWLVSRCGGGK